MPALADLTPMQAFAAIPLAAICCDQTFATEEAEVIRQQLLSRAAYRAMEPYAFGMLISGLLKRLREESWQELIAAAVPQLNLDQQETAFALVCQLIHCDRKVAAVEQEFLLALADLMSLEPSRTRQILEVCEVMHRDCL
ncbi:tellurite resistance TerB family protein [Vulcanococcus limneticus]|nr:tellurite resistance TerB family protein [Vulcanococcus limneticus]